MLFTHRINRRISGVLVAAAALVLAPVVHAQIPNEFKNLQVLHKDISKRDLMTHMKGFTSALGVRCEHCHKGEAGMRLSQFDFASDDKQAKKTARVMLQMVDSINNVHLAAFTKSGDNPVVNCATCHRGLPKPRTIDDTLSTLKASGTLAALDGYGELRSKHFGGGSFDFGEDILNIWASDLMQAGSLDEAQAVLEANAEYHPKSDGVRTMLGYVKLQKGDTAAAVVHFERALELNPDNNDVTGLLKELKR